MAKPSYETLRTLLVDNFDKVRRESATKYTLPFHGSCQSPATVGHYARPGQSFPRKDGKLPVDLVMTVPCRKCQSCLSFKAFDWSTRALHESVWAPRTWFVTLTARPAARFLYETRAENRLRRKGWALEEVSSEKWFRYLSQEMLKEVTKWTKRIREQMFRKLGVRKSFRYLLVVEKHKDGFPHVHALLHEEVKDSLTFRMLNAAWHDGFSKPKLIPRLESDVAAKYVTKYLMKSPLARVRASWRYGTPVTSSDIGSAV